MLSAWRTHKDPCFANGRLVSHPSPTGAGAEPQPSPNQKEIHRVRLTICRLAVIAAALGLLLAPASASAVATAKQIEEATSKGITYLKEQQKEGGEMPSFGGDWALGSLAAVGVASADVNKTGKEGKDARTWYEGLVGVSTWPGEGAVSNDFERAALVSYAAGIDPARISH